MSTAVKRTTAAIVIVIGIMILFSNLAQAQPQRMSVEDRVKILKDSLKLTSEQSSKITSILEDQREEITMAMNENRDNPDSARAAVQGIMKKSDNKIKTILTEDQAKKYDEMLKARRARMGRRTRESGM
jgi:periplasmic protein CpxP/Spy